MKTKKFSFANCIGLLIAIVCIGNMLWLASCKKDEVGEGLDNPVINRIRSLDSSAVDVTSTLAGTWLVAEGKNLLGTSNIYINEYPVSFSPVYVTDKYILFQIPTDVTTTANAKKGEVVPNEIKIVTNHGTVVFPFTVALPPPTIYNLTNEMAPSGTVISFIGAGFLGIEKITFPGGVEATDFNIDKKGTAIRVTVPDGVGVGIISLSGIGLYTQTDSVFHVRGNMLCNFDDVNTFTPADPPAGNDAFVKTDPKFVGADGKFAYMLSVGVGQWSWTSGNTAFVTQSTQWLDPALIGDSVENYAVKFEYFLVDPWITGRFQIANNEWGGDAYRYYFKQWDATAVPVTPVSNGYWQTISIPLTYFKNGDNSAGSGDPTGLAPTSFTDFFNGTDTNKPLIFKLFFYQLAVPKFEAGFDNFRLVKVK